MFFKHMQSHSCKLALKISPHPCTIPLWSSYKNRFLSMPLCTGNHCVLLPRVSHEKCLWIGFLKLVVAKNNFKINKYLRGISIRSGKNVNFNPYLLIFMQLLKHYNFNITFSHETCFLLIQAIQYYKKCEIEIYI